LGHSSDLSVTEATAEVRTSISIHYDGLTFNAFRRPVGEQSGRTLYYPLRMYLLVKRYIFPEKVEDLMD